MFFINRTEYIVRKAPWKITLLDLGELEDLYYAACGKLKDLLGIVNILLSNGFKTLGDPYFTYRSRGYDCGHPTTLNDFKNTLITLETVLYDPSMTEPLNRAVLRKNRRFLHSTALSSPPRGSVSLSNEFLCDRERGRQIDEEGRQDKKRWLTENGGLQDIRNRPSAMIFGELAEKYQTVIGEAQLDRQRQSNAQSLERARFHRHAAFNALSGENDATVMETNATTSRLKKACVCDSECVCIQFCEAEPQRNCFCQEHALFGQETKDLDIEDWSDRSDDESKPFGAGANNLARLIVASYAMPNSPTFDEACKSLEKGIAATDEALLRQHERQQIQQSPSGCSEPSSPLGPTTPKHVDGLGSSGSDDAKFWWSSNMLSIEPHTPYGSDEDCLPSPLFSRSSSASLFRVQARPTFSRRFVSAGACTSENGTRPEVEWNHELPSLQGTGKVSHEILLAPKAYKGRPSSDDQVDTSPKDGRKRSLRNAPGSIKRILRGASQASLRSTNGLLLSPTRGGGTIEEE